MTRCWFKSTRSVGSASGISKASGPAPRRPYHHAIRLRIALIASSCAMKTGGRVRPPLENLRTIAATATSRASFIFHRAAVRFCLWSRAGRVGIDGQPNDPFVRILVLQLLHVTAAVMLFHKWAFRIEPFEHDIFALVLR